MTLTLLYAGDPNEWDAYRDALRTACADRGLDATVTDSTDPARVDYLIATPAGPIEDYGAFPKARAVISLWAGPERLIANPTLTLPLVRMVDPEGLGEGMVEWVTGQVLRHHLSTDRYVTGGTGWDPVVPPLARDRSVTVLGMGELGTPCLRALRALNFDVTGWSRTEKTLDGIPCLHGDDGLAQALARAEIVVLLLPHTPATEGVIDRTALAHLPRGAVLLNPGRGALIDEDAVIDALDSGQLSAATLDVFRTEPLPDDHPFWAHPRVTVTPHIAATTRPASAARRVAEAIATLEVGGTPAGLVDRTTGY